MGGHLRGRTESDMTEATQQQLLQPLRPAGMLAEGERNLDGVVVQRTRSSRWGPKTSCC